MNIINIFFEMKSMLINKLEVHVYNTYFIDKVKVKGVP